MIDNSRSFSHDSLAEDLAIAKGSTPSPQRVPGLEFN